jgi:hypothetical protein
MSRTTFSGGGLAMGAEDFWLIFTLLAVTMSQKSSVPQLCISVSRVLTPGNLLRVMFGRGDRNSDRTTSRKIGF